MTPVKCCLCLLAFLYLASPAGATSIFATTTGCVGVTPSATGTTFAWSYSEHFQAVVFHDPISGCGTTIDERSDWLLQFTPNYDAHGGLRVTSNSAAFPTCGRLQFDMHKYLADGTLDPLGLISLVVDFGVDCSTPVPVDPDIPPEPHAVPEQTSSLVLFSMATVTLFALRRRWEPALMLDVVGGKNAQSRE